MRIRIAARKSDLARLQAKMVGAALQKTERNIKIEYQFRASLGDLNQSDPLWRMPEKGIFTEDFIQDLLHDQCDLVVHSWKDLPTIPRLDTEIVATLPRADTRDIFLFRRDRWNDVRSRSHLRVLTSSPRRSHNLQDFFQNFLPLGVQSVEFQPVRGNIQTRLNKLLAQDVDGLIVAKAALDRLLSAGERPLGPEPTGQQATIEEQEFMNSRADVAKSLKACCWMVLPLTINPTAAAQGALAVEVKKGRHDLIEILRKINSQETMRCVEIEREILKSYGGGCHQKIGVTVLAREYGDVLFLRGETDQGETLYAREIRSRAGRDFFPKATSPEFIWPLDSSANQWFQREPLPEDPRLQKAPFLWIARESAWPGQNLCEPDRLVWTAGLQTWQKLAARGIWVNGSAEGLGELEPTRIETLARAWGKSFHGPSIPWLKLTHEESATRYEAKSDQFQDQDQDQDKDKDKDKKQTKNTERVSRTSAKSNENSNENSNTIAVPASTPIQTPPQTSTTNTDTTKRSQMAALATYRLVPIENKPDLRHKTHFYWMSGSSFDEALKAFPEIEQGYHFCGPGQTFRHISGKLGAAGRVRVCLSHEDWLKLVLDR